MKRIEVLLDVAADAVPAFPGACQNNRRYHRLRAPDALRMVVRHLGGLPASASASPNVAATSPHGETRIAEPLPKLP